MKEWLLRHAPWLSFVVIAVIGGIVAHVREWDVLHPGYTFKQHVLMLLRRSIMASLAGLLWYFLTEGMQWQNSPFAFMGAAIVGLFASEFFDLLWVIGKRMFLQNAHLPDNTGSKGK